MWELVDEAYAMPPLDTEELVSCRASAQKMLETCKSWQGKFETHCLCPLLLPLLPQRAERLPIGAPAAEF